MPSYQQTFDNMDTTAEETEVVDIHAPPTTMTSANIVLEPPPPEFIDHNVNNLTPPEFAEDVELRLGRANGNVYHRKPGVAGMHDGQIMVRLKKKRFIIIDYGIVPEAQTFPPGAGKQMCASPECRKVGVPYLLYDSVPEEPSSLYLRSGLCFTCQRALNEKRRTQRKRKSDDGGPSNTNTREAYHRKKAASLFGNIIGGNNAKKNLMQFLPEHAVIIAGPPEGTRIFGEDYGMAQIAADVRQQTQESLHDVCQLFNAVNTVAAPTLMGERDTTSAVEGRGTGMQEEGPSASTGSNNAIAMAAAAAAAADISNTGVTVNNGGIDTTAVQVHHNVNHNGNETMTTAADDADAVTTAAASLEPPLQPLPVVGLDSNIHSNPMENQVTTTADDVNAFYEKSLLSLKKSIFLLTQWKASWDAAANSVVAAAAAAAATDAIVAAAAENNATLEMTVAEPDDDAVTTSVASEADQVTSAAFDNTNEETLKSLIASSSSDVGVGDSEPKFCVEQEDSSTTSLVQEPANNADDVQVFSV